MRVQLFTFRFSPTLGAFDDTPLKDFIRDKEVLAFREHFFVVSDVPHLACVVTYQDAVVPPEAIAEVDELGRSVVIHGLRHTFASELGRAGVGLVRAQRLLGHSTPELTAQVYTHLGIDDLRGAVEKLEPVRKRRAKPGA